MKLYNKRIAFLISDQHLIPHGGIGQFAKGFVEMCSRINWKVDILLDKEPTNDFSNLIKDLGANIITPKEPLKYSDHTATFAFSDSINFEKVINFRKSILKAFEVNIYDMIVCNTHEAMTAAHAVSIGQYIPVVFYTHSTYMIFREKQKFSDVFLDTYNDFYVKHTELNDVYVGTQSITNLNHLESLGHKNAVYLPMSMTERDLLTKYTGDQKGVLFIGRWEERKNPAAYIKVMKETQLPCKVMTNSSGAKKFEKAFNEAGITDYEIRAGIVGQEKSDFIKGCKVFFMPSQGESYGFAFLECLGHMPCVVLDNQDWSVNFDEKYFHKEKLENVGNLIKELYNVDNYYSTGALDYVKQLDNDVSQSWITFLDNFVSKRSNTNAAKINNYDTICYRDYIKELEREHLAREDFESVLANRHKFIINTYTDDNSYLSKDPIYKPVEEETGESLFTFI
jgi:glycosyltransferase involved in cell wall biosynthesis